MGYGKYFHYGLKHGTVPPFQGAEHPTDHAHSWGYFSDRLWRGLRQMP